MTAPIGGILAGVLAGATGRTPRRAKASMVGERYVLEVPNEPMSPGVALATISGVEGSFAGLLLFPELLEDGVYALAVGSCLFGLFSALLLVPPMRCVAFDDRAIHSYSPWRRRPQVVCFRDIVSVRKSLFRELYVVRTSSKQKLRLRGDWHGFATLARLLLGNVPASTRMNRRTRAALVGLAHLDEA